MSPGPAGKKRPLHPGESRTSSSSSTEDTAKKKVKSKRTKSPAKKNLYKNVEVLVGGLKKKHTKPTFLDELIYKQFSNLWLKLKKPLEEGCADLQRITQGGKKDLLQKGWFGAVYFLLIYCEDLALPLIITL